MQNQNAIIGETVERRFKNSIGHHPEVIEILQSRFGISEHFSRAYLTGPDGGKSDVILGFEDGRTLGANIKAFSAGFNQVTRLRIGTFCSQFNLEHLSTIFETGVVRVASRQGGLILPEDQAIVGEHLSPIAQEIIRWALAGTEMPKLLVLFERTINRMHLFDMAAALGEVTYTVSFSARGVIKIGEFFSIQRKGGDGNYRGPALKTSLEHPGNNLQIKMKVRDFVNSMRPLISYVP